MGKFSSAATVKRNRSGGRQRQYRKPVRPDFDTEEQQRFDADAVENCAQREIHRGFFVAGSDGIETNTFNATQLVLDEFGMGDKLDEINRLNIRIAKEVAAEFATPEKPRFVVGSVGPGTKMPSLTDPSIYADFDRLADAYRRQLQIMIEERVDAILVETCFDILQAKCIARKQA